MVVVYSLLSRLLFKDILYRPVQTDATSHNIVSPTMLEVVGTCCVAYANERTTASIVGGCLKKRNILVQ